MKKILTLIFAMLLIASMAASCDLDTPTEKTNQEATDNPDIIKDAPADEEIADEIQTVAAVGTAYELGDWTVTVNSMVFVDSVSDNPYTQFTPEDGSKYLSVDITVVNNGTSGDTFMDPYSFSTEVTATVIYKENYKYKHVNLLGYNNSINNQSVQPLASKTGELTIEIPETVINDIGNAKLFFAYGKSEIVFDIQ